MSHPAVFTLNVQCVHLAADKQIKRLIDDSA